MEVNELLGRFEKVKNSAPRYSARKGIGLPILKVRFEERIKKAGIDLLCKSLPKRIFGR